MRSKTLRTRYTLKAESGKHISTTVHEALKLFISYLKMSGVSIEGESVLSSFKPRRKTT
jgi:hypothetical protein